MKQIYSSNCDYNPNVYKYASLCICILILKLMQIILLHSIVGDGLGILMELMFLLIILMALIKGKVFYGAFIS